MVTFELRIILVFLSAFFGAIFVLPKLAHIAQRIGLLDQPNGRKVHTQPRPLVGGIGMVIAATFSSLVFIPLAGLRGYFLGLAILLLVGFFDDFLEIGHKQKFLAQIMAAVLLIYFSKVSLVTLGDLLGIGELTVPGGAAVVWLVTVFCVVGVVNAVNLIDGLDGLAGGVSFIAFIFFAVHASFAGNHTLMLLNLALAGAVLGFLKFNWHPSVLFMGDAGSLCLGFSLAFMALALTQGENSAASPITALLILAVPITDTIVIMFKRIIRGINPFKADKYHLHHIFLRYGMGRAGAVRAILGLSFLMGCLSLLKPVYDIPEWYLFLGFSVYFAIYVISSFYILWLLRYSFKFRKKKPQNGSASHLLKMLFGSFDLFRLFRKSPRFDVNLKVQCRSVTGEEGVQGMILNISSDGCMACIKGLDLLHDKMLLTVTFPFDSCSHAIEIPVEHLWVSEHEGKHYHGFRFQEFAGGQEQVIFKFLVRFNKKSHGAVRDVAA